MRPAVACDLLRRAVKADGAAVVPEPLPGADHVAGGRGGERLDGRPALEPGEVARDDPVDLGLLQHHLGDEDRVRVTCPAPREIASGAPEPLDQELLHAGIVEPREERGRTIGHVKTGREVLVVDAVRTPIGKAHPERGYYRDVHPNALLGATYVEVLERAGVDPAAVEDVITGCVQQYGEQSYNIGRNAWLQAGLPVETPATTIDRQCGSGQQAVNFAAALVASGVHDIVIGSGVEHMGHVPLFIARKWVDDVGTPFPPALLERHELVAQGMAAEMIADRWGISREELDQFGLRSQTRAAVARDEGRFARETMPFEVDGSTYVADQGIRDTSLEALAALEPAFKKDGKVTAGNSSQISDGAAALVLASRRKVDELVPSRAHGSSTRRRWVSIP